MVAIKLIRQELLADTEVVRRFYREMQITSRLEHPNIVRAFDSGRIGQTHFLAMEYVEGINLSSLVKQSGPLAVPQACDYIRQAALGLQHAHERGLIHRDVKPSNLMLSFVPGPSSFAKTANTSGPDEGQSTRHKAQSIKILDLGLARLQTRIQEEPDDLTLGGRTGSLTPVGSVMMGTPDYVAPEQALDFHSADIRSDIYGLGCTFFFLLTGEPPFAGGTTLQKLIRHQQAEPPPVEKRRPDLPPQLVLALRKMLAKRPEDRYQTPAEVVQVFSSLLDGGSTSAARPVSPVGPRRRWPVLAGASVLLVFVALVGWMVKTSGGSADSGQRIESETAEQAWVKLLTQAEHAQTRSAKEELRVGLIELRRRFPGSLQALQAAERLMQLPSPLDALHCPIQKGQPQELVEVLEAGGGGGTTRLVAISPDGKWLAATGAIGRFQVWELPTTRPVVPIPIAAHQMMINALTFCPDGGTLATASADGTIKLWDVSSGACRQTLDGHTGEVLSAEFSPDGKKLATGGKDQIVKLWTLETKQAQSFKGHEAEVTCLAFQPDGKRLISAGYNGAVKVWDLDSGQLAFLPLHDPPTIFAMALSPDGTILATAGSHRSKVKLFNLKTGESTVLELKPNQKFSTARTSALVFAPDGRSLFSVGQENGMNRFIRWDVASGKPLGQYDEQFPPVNGKDKIALASDGRHLALPAGVQVYILRIALPPRVAE